MESKFKMLPIALIIMCTLNAYGKNARDEVPIEASKEVTRPNSEVPIICEKDSDAGVLDFTFAEDVGNVVVEVSNIMTGEKISTTINSAYGLGTVAISQQDGVYKVTLKTSDGEYVGYFNN